MFRWAVIMRGSMAATALSHAYPLGSRLNERGHLEVGGCDVFDLARDSARPRTSTPRTTSARGLGPTRRRLPPARDDFEVIYACKALPCTAAFRVMGEEGLSCDVASGGELHLALDAGFDPERLFMHGNNKTEEELKMAFDAGVGHIVLDSFDEIERSRF